jgi:hypothetical protein
MRREPPRIDPVWVVAVVGGILVLAVILWLRRRRLNRILDVDILTARAMDRKFTPEERALIQELAKLRECRPARWLVPKIRAYDAALENFLSRLDLDDEEERERLIEQLASMRSKLGFEKLPAHRYLPSTRELDPGQELNVRVASRGGDSFRAAVVHDVNDLQLKARFVSRTPGGDFIAADPPEFEVGDSFEAVFEYGLRRRGRFVARVTGHASGDERVVPLAHVRIDTFTLQRHRRSDLNVEARLRDQDGRDHELVIVGISAGQVELADVLPGSVRDGVLAFTLPGEEDVCQIEAVVVGDDTSGEEKTLQFRKTAEETRQRIL